MTSKGSLSPHSVKKFSELRRQRRGNAKKKQYPDKPGGREGPGLVANKDTTTTSSNKVSGYFKAIKDDQDIISPGSTRMRRLRDLGRPSEVVSPLWSHQTEWQIAKDEGIIHLEVAKEAHAEYFRSNQRSRKYIGWK
ncbi:hypothetical protein QLX08_008348 [Tetragonisca angustula]|uniref:Uncharacterized protein n=1 Tax=Tetragonisca angustula TaxID=166442 RepID=A0AAW0ZM75_9HYME